MIDYLLNLEFWPTYLWGCLAALPVGIAIVFADNGITMKVKDVLYILSIAAFSWPVAAIGIVFVVFGLFSLCIEVIINLIFALLEMPFCNKKLF